ncbi:hypothetical protein D3C81_1353050 [compost metagenome]
MSDESQEIRFGQLIILPDDAFLQCLSLDHRGIDAFAIVLDSDDDVLSSSADVYLQAAMRGFPLSNPLCFRLDTMVESIVE